MTNIVKFFVQDEKGNVVGTFVVDMDSLIDLYLGRLRGELEPPGTAEVSENQTGLVRRVAKMFGWYRDAPGGKLYLQRIPLDDQL